MDSRNFHINKRPSPSLALEELRSGRKIIRYKECLKNHAAAIGGNATDGCGEFMAGGDEGTPEALKCSACNCHRNFHRKEIQSDSDHSPSPYYLSPLLPSTAQNPSDQSDEDGVREVEKPADQMGRKRFRTKFSQEQKEKMLRFAEKAGWSIQKLEESVVQQVCQEVGIKRRVLKVWMHNNKNSLAKRNSPPPS